MAKILIVDDANFMRMIIKDALMKEGYTELYEASDGEEAIEMYDLIHPDLIIMDITMPRLDGLSALKAIKEKDPNASVVMCSAMGQESIVIEAVKAGAKDFIVKPFKTERFLRTVANIIG